MRTSPAAGRPEAALTLPLFALLLVACEQQPVSVVESAGVTEPGTPPAVAPAVLPRATAPSSLDSGVILRLDSRSHFFRDTAGTQACVNGDSCGYWEDLSGNGFHAKAAAGMGRPLYRSSALGGVQGLEWTLNSRPRMLSSGDPAAVRAALRRNFTLFVAATKVTGARTAALLTKEDPDNGPFNINVRGNRPCFYGTQLANGAFFTYAITQDTFASSGGGWPGSYFRHYQNGSAYACYKPNGEPTVPATGLTIGDIPSGSTWQSWDGCVLTVLMYNRTLNPAEVWQLDQQLRAVYRQPWPGDASDRIVIWDGNSISASGHIPRLVAQQLGWPMECFINLSWGAKSTGDQLACMARDVEPFASALPAGKMVISVQWELTNDLFNGGPAAAYPRCVSYGRAMQGLGFRRVVGTCLPRVGNAAFETGRKAVNDSIRAGYQSFADVVADVALDPLIGVDGMNPNPNPYYGDGVHPTPAGDSIIAPHFAQALRMLEGSTGILNEEDQR